MQWCMIQFFMDQCDGRCIRASVYGVNQQRPLRSSYIIFSSLTVLGRKHSCVGTAEVIIKPSNKGNHLKAFQRYVNADMSISTQLLHRGRNHRNK